MSGQEPQEIGDLELITAAAGGDRGAIGRLYDRYAGLLLAVGYRILNNRREAEDLAHDVFIEAWQRAGDYQASRGTVRTWLLLRTRSRALDRVRSPAFSRVVAVEREALDAVAPATDERGAIAGDRERVHQALSQLPADQRAVVEFAYFEGLSASEIAARLGVPLGTVKSRTAAALAKLRTGLRAGEDEP